MSYFAYSWKNNRPSKLLLGDWLWDLTKSQEAIIQALFNFGNTAMASHELAVQAELNENTVRRILGEMVKDGLVVKERDTDGVTVYRVADDEEVEMESEAA